MARLMRGSAFPPPSPLLILYAETVATDRLHGPAFEKTPNKFPVAEKLEMRDDGRNALRGP